MADAIPDLWPDIVQSDVVLPVAILREQAAALGNKTGHLLEGRVSTTTDEDGNLTHWFYVVAPALDNYVYRLFWIKHAAEPYPVTAEPSPGMRVGIIPVVRIDSQEELVDYIRRVLSSDKTKRIVGSLLAQVKATT